MTFKSLHKTKRLPFAIGTLLSGVVFAGFVSSMIETPIGSNAYLHEHLVPSVSLADQTWVGETFVLPVQDRVKLAAMVMDVDQSQWTPTRRTAAFRVGRDFSELHANKDLRVVNVKETSLRATFNADLEEGDLTLGDIVNETRLFRFYQTQNGWTQKTSEVLAATSIDFKDRDGKFAAKFAADFVGINYYPASASWKEFWTDFPVDEIRSDLETIRKMKANAVRIFLNHDYFENADTQEDAQTKLRVFLDLCAAQNIQVLVTLFDLRPDYTLSNLSADAAHIDKVLSPVSAHSAILGIDIKNQADLDFPAWGQGVVEGWASVMARHIQIHYPELPVTVGWSNPDAALGLKDVVDFVTYHEYGDVKGFAARLEEVKTGVGDKPVMITELGSTIWTPFRSTRAAEAKQASRLESQLRQSIAADGVFVWTLNDFDHVGSDVVGRRPWRKAQQRHFGLLRADGSSRPSHTVLQAHAENLALQPLN